MPHNRQPPPPPPNRIELIPIEWYDKIHASNSSLKNNLVSSTLAGVPKLRSIANDVIFDVLMYMTPEFCEEVLNCVTGQINELYDSFQVVNPGFSDQGYVVIVNVNVNVNMCIICILYAVMCICI